jgi:hypothetical protein
MICSGVLELLHALIQTYDGLSAFNKHSTKMDTYLTKYKGKWEKTQDIKI